jgi:serine/threonine protein kinase
LNTLLLARREITIMQKAKHENIVQIFSVFETLDIAFSMELMIGGDLCTYMKSKIYLSESLARSIFAQILEAVVFLHSSVIIHCDIKCENIVLGSCEFPDSIQAKLIDFGFSDFFSTNIGHQTFCGTLAYAAPEMILCENYGPEVDVWSLCVVLFVMMTYVLQKYSPVQIYSNNLRPGPLPGRLLHTQAPLRHFPPATRRTCLRTNRQGPV